MEPSRIQERLIDPVRSDGPLQALVSLQPFVTDTREQWGHRGDLIHDFRRALIIPASAEPICDVLDDDPVRPASFERLEDLIDSLNAALGAGERALLFEARAGGQNHIGKPASLAEKDILHYEEIEFSERFRDMVDVRVDKSHLFAI